MNNQYIKINENGQTAVYSWMDKSDSQGYHIRYIGPRGTFVTTHLSFYSVVKDTLKRGLQIIETSFNNVEEVINKATDDIQHEKEVHERWMKVYGSSQILI